MREDPLTVRYWRTLTGVDPALSSLTGGRQFSPATADVGELALWKFFSDGLGRISRRRGHLLSHFKSRIMQHTAPTEERTNLSALLGGVQYMMDFTGAKLTQDPPSDPGDMIAEEWQQMMQEIDSFLSGKKDAGEE